MTPDQDTHHHPVVHQTLDKFEEVLEIHAEALTTVDDAVSVLDNRTKALEMYVRTNTSVAERLTARSDEQGEAIRRIVNEVKGHTNLTLVLAVCLAVNSIGLLLLAVTQ